MNYDNSVLFVLKYLADKVEGEFAKKKVLFDELEGRGIAMADLLSDAAADDGGLPLPPGPVPATPLTVVDCGFAQFLF